MYFYLGIVCINKKCLLRERQGLYSLGISASLPLVPVSYTHLDVYKRQIHHSTLNKQTDTESFNCFFFYLAPIGKKKLVSKDR